METKIIKIGSSLGVIIPKPITSETGLQLGTSVELSRDGNTISITKKNQAREGWDTAFAAYAMSGAEEKLLPDHLNVEADALLP